MLIWEDLDAPDSVDVCMVARAWQYDGSSGDSCWVRQYLDWCQTTSAILAETAIGCAPAAVDRTSNK